MAKVLLGAFVAAIAMFITGFIFFATPLNLIAYGAADTAQQAAVQAALASNLPVTGTYQIPWPSDAATTNMYSKGPVATIYYNTAGFGVASPDALIAGFVQEFVVALIIGFTLLNIAGRVTDFGSRARVVIGLSMAALVLRHLAGPIWFHHDWTHTIYFLIGDAAMLIVGGLIIARWFLPRAEPETKT